MSVKDTKPRSAFRLPSPPSGSTLSVLLTMDADLIKLVNKLQDTFSNLGMFHL